MYKRVAHPLRTQKFIYNLVSPVCLILHLRINYRGSCSILVFTCEKNQQRASRHRLGSRRSPLASGATLVWMALRRRAFLSGPHSLHRLLCSRSRGAARRVRGAAGGMEARAGWGRGSERVRAPRTWSLGNVT